MKVEERTRMDGDIKGQFQDDMLKVLRDEIDELTLKLSVKDKRIQELQEKFKEKTSKGDGKDEKIEGLKIENEYLKRDIEEIQEQRESEKNLVREQIQIFRQELNKLRHEHSTNLKSLKEEVSQLKETLKIKDENLLSLTNQLDQARHSLDEDRAHVPEITSIDEVHSKFSKDTFYEPSTYARVDAYTLQKISFIIEENIVLKKECQVLVMQLNQQREEYEEKFKRREEFIRNEKANLERTFVSLKQQNSQLRVSLTNHPIEPKHADAP